MVSQRSMSAEAKATENGAAVVALGNGNTVEVEPHGDTTTVRVRSSETAGCVELEIRFDVNGPVVKCKAASLEVEAPESITTTCEHFHVNARKSIKLETEGDLIQGAGEKLRLRGRSVGVEATPGAIQLKANDDIQLLGEMILLNADRPSPYPKWAQPDVKWTSAVAENRDVLGDDVVVRSLLGEDE